ncbi:MAG: peptidase M48 family protein [Candidatus Muproteobacteria bacterium RBG_16_64_11]|uniref:Peptidase M48 family protein n=1 Tax=Candidatus Muproteobacteria bacterium RBG_16_64_11 TaxID=1817758 RepID=A0A1F6TDE9_9PROT|nr:MAG: peptidase M48 family protein [Candidatus Muproteobacteria bacterium RBG_16_64_11]
MNAHLPLLIVGLALLASGCATVPETGRSQLLLISPAEEFQLGLTEFEKLKKTTPISKDSQTNALVQRVGQRIAAVAKLPNAQWEFVVFDDAKTANAFCLPGGKVGIYTGILPFTRDEAGLATVIGHEVAHAVARHGAERVSEGLLLQMGGQALGQAIKTNSGTTQSIIMGAYGIGAAVGVALPHSRAHELEADRLGLLYMARAGYDPQNAVTFWKRFSEGKSGGGVEWLSTHPLDTRRIAALESHLPQARAEYQKARPR